MHTHINVTTRLVHWRGSYRCGMKCSEVRVDLFSSDTYTCMGGGVGAQRPEGGEMVHRRIHKLNVNAHWVQLRRSYCCGMKCSEVRVELPCQIRIRTWGGGALNVQRAGRWYIDAYTNVNAHWVQSRRSSRCGMKCSEVWIDLPCQIHIRTGGG